MNILGKEKYFNGIQRTPEPMDLSELSPEPESSECLKNLNGHMTLICDTPSSSASLTYTMVEHCRQFVVIIVFICQFQTILSLNGHFSRYIRKTQSHQLIIISM